MHKTNGIDKHITFSNFLLSTKNIIGIRDPKKESSNELLQRCKRINQWFPSKFVIFWLNPFPLLLPKTKKDKKLLKVIF